MNIEPKEPYVYQPYGTAAYINKDAPTRIYAIGGLDGGCRIDGLHRDEADAILKALKELRSPEPCGGVQQDRNGVWLVVYSDRDMQPVAFSGTGADEAARRFFRDASTKWTVRLFQCVAQSGFGPPPTKSGDV